VAKPNPFAKFQKPAAVKGAKEGSKKEVAKDKKQMPAFMKKGMAKAKC
jgi:hypothetical protein